MLNDRRHRVGLREVHAWIDAYKEHWEQRFDRLAAYLKQIEKPASTESGEKPVP